MMTVEPAQAPHWVMPTNEEWFNVGPPPLGVPWYDTPQTWPLWGRLIFGGVLLVSLVGIVRFATKETPPSHSSRTTRRGY